ncbi:MAG: carboxymuconolactone decarboxylase family protein [Gemmatimonadota bacterium]
MTEDVRLLVELSAALGGRDDPRTERILGRAAERAEADGRMAAKVEEALLQAHLFVGFPAVLTAMEVWRELRDAPAAPEEDGLSAPRSTSDWQERGEAVCRRVYGSAYEELRSAVARLHPALDRWMVTAGYGKVLGREGLELDVRELCNVALLAAAGRGPQLHSHARGALLVGAPGEDVELAVEIGTESCRDPADALEARRLWASLAGRDR